MTEKAEYKSDPLQYSDSHFEESNTEPVRHIKKIIRKSMHTREIERIWHKAYHKGREELEKDLKEVPGLHYIYKIPLNAFTI